MYQNFYHLTKKPFDITPDPEFLYLSPQHQETLAAMIYGIRERRGFITVIGEVGTGKTTLLHATLGQLDDQTRSSFIFNTDIAFEELLQAALVDFGLASAEEDLSRFASLERLYRFATDQFAAGKNIVLIIDEAHNLSLPCLENLRLLSNLETTRHKLLQIILSGQPELDEKLRRPEMRQLAQRINLRRYITPLNRSDTCRYIRHHLNIAGCSDPHFFDNASLGLIWGYSGGIPRKINMLCDNALLIGYGLGRKKISSAEVREAIRDLSWSPFVKTGQLTSTRPTKPRLIVSQTAAAAAGAALATVLGITTIALWKPEPDKRALTTNITRPWTAPSEAGLPEKTGQKSPDTAKMVSRNTVAINPTPAAEISDTQNASSTAQANPLYLSVKTGDSWTERRVHPESLFEFMPGDAVRPAVKQAFSEKTGLYPSDGNNSTPADSAFDLIVVRKGDTISKIIEAHHGSFEEMLPQVLQENTQVQNPDLIIPGWVIRLPRRTGGLAEHTEY